MGAWRAIDGNHDGGAYFTCSHTLWNSGAPERWWQVDFGFVAQVDKVTIWNIYASGHWYRIQGATMELLDIDGNILDTSAITMGLAVEPSVETFQFSSPVANVAAVRITSTNGYPLHVCEVEAYGYIQ